MKNKPSGLVASGGSGGREGCCGAGNWPQEATTCGISPSALEKDPEERAGGDSDDIMLL